MKTARKTMLAVLCVLMVVVASVTGTLAYLTDTEAVTNTFTVGNVRITLDEKDVDNDDVTDDNVTVNGVVRDKANEYHLLPGIVHEKDPTVTVLKDSEDSYVRMMVKVENLEQLKAALPKYETVEDEETGEETQVEIEANKIYYNDDIFLLQMMCFDENGCTWDEEHWKFVKFHTESNTYEFRYVGNDTENPNNGIVVKSNAEAGTKLEPLFTHIMVPGTVDNAHLANLKDVKIVVTAHAIQAAGFDDADAAWDAFDDQTK